MITSTFCVKVLLKMLQITKAMASVLRIIAFFNKFLIPYFLTPSGEIMVDDCSPSKKLSYRNELIIFQILRFTLLSFWFMDKSNKHGRVGILEN